jgi:hypothetical protein
MFLQVKAIVYLFCCAAEDEENQKRGCVGLFYFHNATQTAMRLLQRDTGMFDWLPIRIAGGHMCYGDPKLRFVNAMIMLLIGRDRRVRLRLHEGMLRFAESERTSPWPCAMPII